MQEPESVTWERIVAERKPKFEDLRRASDRGQLSPEEQSLLEEHAAILEAAYYLGACDVSAQQKATKRQLLEIAKSYIPYTSHSIIMVFGQHIEVCLELGDVALADIYATQGLHLLETVVEADPNAQDLLNAAARAREAQGRHQEAAELYAAAIKAKPDGEWLPHLIRQAGVNYFDAGLYTEAISYLSSMDRRDDREWAFHQQSLAEAYERVGRLDDAIAVYRGLLEDTPLEERKLIEHLAFRRGFCEARRDKRRVRPTGATRGQGWNIVLPSGGKEKGEGTLTEHERTRLMITRMEQRILSTYSGQGHVIRREEPFQNVVRLRETLRSCEGYIFWADTHFRTRALEELALVVEPTRIKSIRILSREDKDTINDEARRDWRKFRKEMSGKGIQAEWRIVDKKVSHDRYIIAANVCYNVPPVGTLYEGSYGEILRTSNRPPFEEWWSEASPLS